MNCPQCGAGLPSSTCPKCGGEVPEKSRYCCWCGGPIPAGTAETDLSERKPCSDGSCVGTINERNVCSICGKPYKQNAEAAG